MIYPIKVSKLLEATGGKLLKGSPDDLIYSFSTDTRSLNEGDFFVAVIGENFDGHKFLNDAQKKGAAGFIISKDTDNIEKIKTVIKADNTLSAYLLAASIYLDNFNLKKIGITGSVGKTTTKEIMSHVLGAKYKILKPEGSFNNEVGIPQTIFKLEKDHEALILELAMRGKGQISQLCRAVKPDIGIITVIGESHYEFMHSYQAVAEAKAELFEYLMPGGLAVINNDDKFAGFLKSKTKAKIITYAVNNDADFKALNIKNLGFDGTEFTLKVKNKEEFVFKTALLGKSNISNILAALAVGFYFNIPVFELQEKVKTLTPAYRRMQKKMLPNNVVLLDDCYNASPTSTISSLNVVRDLDIKGKKIAVLADMLELGEIEKDAHYNTGKRVLENKIDFLILLGKMAETFKKGAVEAGFAVKDIFIAGSNKEAADKLKEIIKKDDLILLKGSRRMKLEEIEEELLK